MALSTKEATVGSGLLLVHRAQTLSSSRACPGSATALGLMPCMPLLLEGALGVLLSFDTSASRGVASSLFPASYLCSGHNEMYVEKTGQLIWQLPALTRIRTQGL